MSRATWLTDGTDPLWNEFLRISDTAVPSLPVESFAGARILITGAGGSIGSAIARAVATGSPASLVLVDSSEHGLYRLQQQLTALVPQPSAAVLRLGSVTDRAFLREVFTVHAPEIVFHAAAVKHVSLAESNPLTAAHVNVLGTSLVLEHAAASGARHVIHLSTDKAVEPISVLGVTKRIAELLVLANHSATVATAVRLPNVLGSSGSVGPLFVEQASQQVPLTVTAPNVSRFFLSLRQAVSALLEAAARPIPGILLPDVQPARAIVDLARFVHARCHAGNDVEVPMEFTGLRAGDKLSERLLSAVERAAPLGDSSLSLVTSTTHLAPHVLDKALAGVREAISQRDRDLLVHSLRLAMPGYAVAAQQHSADTREVCESTA